MIILLAKNDSKLTFTILRQARLFSLLVLILHFTFFAPLFFSHELEDGTYHSFFFFLAQKGEGDRDQRHAAEGVSTFFSLRMNLIGSYGNPWRCRDQGMKDCWTQHFTIWNVGYKSGVAFHGCFGVRGVECECNGISCGVTLSSLGAALFFFWAWGHDGYTRVRLFGWDTRKDGRRTKQRHILLCLDLARWKIGGSWNMGRLRGAKG